MFNCGRRGSPLLMYCWLGCVIIPCFDMFFALSKCRVLGGLACKFPRGILFCVLSYLTKICSEYIAHFGGFKLSIGIAIEVSSSFYPLLTLTTFTMGVTSSSCIGTIGSYVTCIGMLVVLCVCLGAISNFKCKK